MSISQPFPPFPQPFNPAQGGFGQPLTPPPSLGSNPFPGMPSDLAAGAAPFQLPSPPPMGDSFTPSGALGAGDPMAALGGAPQAGVDPMAALGGAAGQPPMGPGSMPGGPGGETTAKSLSKSLYTWQGGVYTLASLLVGGGVGYWLGGRNSGGEKAAADAADKTADAASETAKIASDAAKDTVEGATQAAAESTAEATEQAAKAEAKTGITGEGLKLAKFVGSHFWNHKGKYTSAGLLAGGAYYFLPAILGLLGSGSAATAAAGTATTAGATAATGLGATAAVGNVTAATGLGATAAVGNATAATGLGATAATEGAVAAGIAKASTAAKTAYTGIGALTGNMTSVATEWFGKASQLLPGFFRPRF